MDAVKQAAPVVKSSAPWGFILTALLAILKVNGLFNVSWLWVFAPIWGPLVLLLAIILIVLIVVVIGAGIGALAGN